MLAVVFCSADNVRAADVVPGELIIKLGENVDSQGLDEIASENDLEKGEIITTENVALLKLKDGEENVAEKMAEIESDPRVEYVQPNFVYQSFGISTDDTYKDSLWGLDNVGQIVNSTAGTINADINAPEAWNISEGSENQIIVAVIDDGIVYNHPDLAANMWDGNSCVGDNGASWGECVHGYDFLNDDKDPLEDATDSHGTTVSGVIGALKNNGIGSIGVAPHAKIMALRIGNGSGEGFTTDKAIRAVAFAKNNGAKVINASWGGNESDLLLKQAVDSFEGLFVTSAGNNKSDNTLVPVYPCNFDSPNVICVAATDQNDQLWTESTIGSNWGSGSVDLGAPGVNILSTANNQLSGYALSRGTSLAAPFVSGAAALVWGQNSVLSAAQVKMQILETGDGLPSLANKTLTGKRLNLFAALGGTGIVVQGAYPFSNTSVSFKDDEVKDGKTRKDEIKLKFKNTQSAVQFMVSRRADFSGDQWETISDGKKVSIKKVSGKSQSFYVKFRNSNGIESGVYKKKVQYESKPKRKIKNSKNTVKVGATLIQKGYGFSKNTKIELHFGSNITIVKSNKQGAFQLSYKVNKSPGKYSWYALDLKTGKKSKTITYKVVR